jgi:ATP-dependent HslUV protease subunit HslV
MLIVDKDVSLTVTGAGDVMEPVDGIIAIGSGGSYALAAARALAQATDLDAMEIAQRAMRVAAELCVYTNNNFVADEIVYEEVAAAATAAATDAAAAAAAASPLR